MRAVVYSAADVRLFELRSDEILECRMDETINGERAVTITTTRELEKGQRILIRPDGGEWSEWCMEGADEGRPHGAASGTYYLPWSLKSDLEGVICSKMPGTKTPVDARTGLEAALSGTKRWRIGDVSVYTTGGVSMWNVSGWKALSLVTKTWGGELDSEIVVNKSRVTNRIVHLRDQLGSKVAVHRFEYSHDLKDVSRVVADQRVYCRVIPRGKGESTEDGGTGRKTGIESVNGGLNYIEDVEAAQAFRVPSGHGWEYPTVIIENGNIEDPVELKAWALSVLHDYTTPQVSYKASVVTLGFTPSLGDVVHVVDNGFIGGGIRLQARVQRIVTNLLDPTDVQVYLGNITNGLPGMFSSLDAKISNAVNQAKQDITAQVDTALSNLDIELDMTEIDRRFDAAEAAYEEVKAQADATQDRAVTLARQITNVTTTVNDTVLPGMQTLETSISGAVSDASYAVEASSTITQTVNGIILGTNQAYTDMVGNITNTLKNDSSLAITPTAIKGVVTANYINSNLNANSIDGLVGSRYIASTVNYQTADQIYSQATGTAKTYTDNQLTEYTKTANLSVEAGSIKANVLAILNDSYGSGGGADPYIRASNVTLTDNRFSILFQEGVVSGGVNMLLDTNRGTLANVNAVYDRMWSYSGTTYATAPAFCDISAPPVVGIEKGIKFVIAAADVGKSAKHLTWYDTTDVLPVVPFEDGETYTVSCYARKASGSSNDVNILVTGIGSKDISVTKSTWSKFTYTFMYDESSASSSGQASYRGRVAIGVKPKAAGTVEICGFKCEHGPVATDWNLNPIEYTAETLLAQTTADTASTTAYNALDMASAADSKATIAMGDATTAIQRQTAYYGTCGTAAGTAAKVVDCTNYHEVEGSTITVQFSNANTVAATDSAPIKLKVNNGTAKNVFVAGSVTSDTNRLYWAPGAQLTFVYDGTQYNLVSDPRAWRASCSTAASTNIKEMTVDRIVLCKGTTLVADMSNSNTATDPSIDIRYTSGNSTARMTYRNLYAGSGSERPMNSNGYGWTVGSTVPFVFDGKYWRMGDSASLARAIAASKTATNYMEFTAGENGGLVIGDMTASQLGRNIQIQSSAINFRYGSAILGQIQNVQQADPSNPSVTKNYMKFNNGANYGGVLISGTNLARLTASEGTGIGGESYVDSRANVTTTNGVSTEIDSCNIVAKYPDQTNGPFSAGMSVTASSQGTALIDFVVQRGLSSGMLSMFAYNSGGTTNLTLNAVGWTEISLGRTVLYNGTDSGGDVTLNSDVTKFKRVRIYYADNRGTLCGCVDVPQLVVGVCINIYTVTAADNSTTWVKRTVYEVSTTTKLSPVYAGQVSMNHSTGAVSGTTNGTNYIRILRVEGHNMY